MIRDSLSGTLLYIDTDFIIQMNSKFNLYFMLPSCYVSLILEFKLEADMASKL